MTDPARWARVKGVFAAALEREPHDRAAYVLHTCGDDAVLKADVESLLSAHQEAGNFAEQPAILALSDAIGGHAGIALNRAFEPGDRIGSYEIVSFLAAGGMGEVYRAVDSTLGRDVAIKVLPDEQLTDSRYRARLEREARLLAALNHPNIAAIYGITENDGVRGLVLELVEGETLAERIAGASGRPRGMRLRDALSIALQIAEALEAAHERGIIHRDLKPKNIKIGLDGRVKVLDFGIARFVGEGGSAAAGPGTETRESAVFGTASYVSPEQARGERVDGRSDVWAFGCILYEMLTGERAFDGSDAAETISSVLHQDPDFSKLPPETPSAVVRLMSLCLEKDRSKRLPHVAVARFQLADTIANPSDGSKSGAAHRHRFRIVAMLGVACGLAAGLALASFLRWPTNPVAAPVTRLLVGVTPAEQIGGVDGRPTRTAFAISPDGNALVFSAVREGQRALYMRHLSQSVAVPMPGTDGAESPFFSPDGRWVGYWANGTIRKVQLSGGPPIPVTEVAIRDAYGASWGDDDRIVFSNGTSLLEVPAGGGPVKTLTALDETQGECSHRLPHVLPGSDAVFFTITKNRFPRWDETDVAIYSRRTGRSTVLVNGGADARYAASGHLVYVRESVLLAAPFDLDRLELTGGPVGLAADVMQAAYFRGQRSDSGAGQFAMSTTGTLVYVRGGTVPPDDRVVVRVDRSGRSETLPLTPQPFVTLRLAPNGQAIALSTFGRERSVWLYELSRNSFSKLPAAGRNSVPIWTPDSERITYTGGVSGPDRLQTMRADGAGTAQPVMLADNDLVPASWTADSRELLYYPVPPSAIRVHAVDSPGPPLTLRAMPAGATIGGADLSPDGRWIAYHSNESGESQVYVQAYPAGVPRYQISSDGGLSPIWRRDGQELFYLRPSGAVVERSSGNVAVTAVAVRAGRTLRFGVSTELFNGPFAINQPARAYDVTPDGESFMLLKWREPSAEQITHISVVQNWFQELQRLMPRR
jgi:serine/threonine-protein kinase